jgi:hypothetical protein
MQTDHANKIPDDEIDVHSVGWKIYRVVVYPFSLFASNIKTTLLFFIAAILAAVSFKYVSPKIYKSSFIIRPTDISDKIYLKVLADIPALLKQKDYAALSEILKTDPAIVSKISGIFFVNSVFKNKIDSLNCTEIIIETTDHRQFIPIQNAIVNYLENNPYFSKIKTLQKKQIDLSLQQVDKDIAQLDSLKKLQLINYGKQNITNQSIIPLNELFNPTAAYSMGMDRVEKKSSLLAQLVFLDRFQLVKNCAPATHHSSPERILVMCLYFIPTFMILCFIFLFFKNFATTKNRVD